MRVMANSYPKYAPVSGKSERDEMHVAALAMLDEAVELLRNATTRSNFDDAARALAAARYRVMRLRASSK